MAHSLSKEKELFDLSSVSISGPLLASLLHEPGAFKTRKSPTLSYREGILHGYTNRHTTRSTADNQETSYKSNYQLVLEKFIVSGGRCSFYDCVGHIDQSKLCAAVSPNFGDPEDWAGFFVVKKGDNIRPSLRELQVYRNLRSLKGVLHTFVMLILTIHIVPDRNTQSFRYSCLYEDLNGKISLLPIDVRNLKHDSAAEYCMFNPSPLPELIFDQRGIKKFSDSNDEQIPEHIAIQESMFHSTMKSLKELVREIATAEETVSKLQTEKDAIVSCLEIL